MKKYTIILPIAFLFILILSMSSYAYLTSTVIDINSSKHSTAYQNWICLDASADTSRRFVQKVEPRFNSTEAITTYWETEGTAGNRQARKFLIYYSDSPTSTTIPANPYVLTLNDTTSPDNTVFSTTIQSALLRETKDYLVIENLPMNYSDNSFIQYCSDIEYKPRMESSSAGLSYGDNTTTILYFGYEYPSYSGNHFATAYPTYDIPFIIYSSAEFVPDDAEYVPSNSTYVGAGGTGEFTKATYTTNNCLGASIFNQGGSSACWGKLNGTHKEIAFEFNNSYEKIDAVKVVADGGETVMHIRSSLTGADLFTSTNSQKSATAKSLGTTPPTYEYTFHFDTSSMNLNLDENYYMVLEVIDPACTSSSTYCMALFTPSGAGDKYVQGETCSISTGDVTQCGFDDFWFANYGDGTGGNLINSIIIRVFNGSLSGNQLTGVILNISNNDAYIFSGQTSSPFEIPRMLNTWYTVKSRYEDFTLWVKSFFVDGDSGVDIVIEPYVEIYSPDLNQTIKATGFNNFTATSRELSEDGWVYGTWAYVLSSGEPEYMDYRYYPIEDKIGVRKDDNLDVMLINGSEIYYDAYGLSGLNNYEVQYLVDRLMDLDNGYVITQFTLSQLPEYRGVQSSGYLDFGFGLTSLLRVKAYKGTNLTNVSLIMEDLSEVPLIDGTGFSLLNNDLKVKVVNDFTDNTTDFYLDTNDDGYYESFLLNQPISNTTRNLGLADDNDYGAFGIRGYYPYEMAYTLDDFIIIQQPSEPTIPTNITYQIKLRVQNNESQALAGVKVDAQFIIPNEDTVKYTDSNGEVIFTFPSEEHNWAFQFTLAGYDFYVDSFDTSESWQYVTLDRDESAGDTELWIYVQNQSNNEPISNAYVSLDTSDTAYTNPLGWVKFVDDGLAGTRTITVQKSGYETEISTKYVTLHQVNNKTMLMTPTTTPTTMKVNVTDTNGDPVESFDVAIWGNGLNPSTSITGSNGIATFTDIPAGDYEVWLDKPLWRSYRYNVSLPVGLTTQFNYVVDQNEIAMVWDYYTTPPETENGSYEVNISAYTEVEYHFNVTDENPESVVCLLYPYYDENPTFFVEGSWDTENEEVICSYIYTTSDTTRNTRIWVIDAETRSQGWLNNPIYFDFTVNIGGFTEESIMFEEDFEYLDGISNHGWSVWGLGVSPTNNELLLAGDNTNNGKFIYHTLGEYGENDFYCTWKQKNVLGNSHAVLFNNYNILVENDLADDMVTHLYWFPPRDTVADLEDYTLVQPDGLNSYGFPFVIADAIGEVTSTLSFYPVPLVAGSDYTWNDHRAIGQWDRLEYYEYTIYYDYELKTYNLYQDDSTLLQSFGVHDPNMRHPDSIGFAITGNDDYVVYIDDISCKIGIPDFVTDEVSEHGWRDDGSFDYSQCNADENKYWCVFRNGWNWATGNLVTWVFSNIILVAVLIVLIIMFAPLFVRRKK